MVYIVLMSMVALTYERWPTRRMVDTSGYEAAERARAGAALKILRKRSGLSQEKAASIAGIGTQTWQNYEVGRRGMDLVMLGRVTSAIGATVEEHALAMARLAPPTAERGEPSGFSDRPRSMQIPVGGVAYGGTMRPNVYDEGGSEVIDFAQFFTPGTRVLRLAGESMMPYAEPGGFVTYSVKRPPRRGFGCVIEMMNGSYAVKRFERMDNETLTVTELYPEERELTFPVAEVRGVYAVGLRGD